jgi:cyclopropane-fatty-acyl-phospholipid synthase
MFEHVGVMHYPTYFQRVRDLLAEDGVAVIHTIGRSDGPSSTNAWVEKYIFPGGYIPALSEVVPAIEESGLFITDIEILRLHYADTLKHWRHRFLEKWDQVADIYDERFCRMWEFYLAASETAFRYEGMMVLQIQLTKHQDALPLTRDYMLDWERERMGADAGGNTENRLAGE